MRKKFSFRHSMRWSIFISILTFILACIFSVTSTIILEGVGWGLGMIVVFALVLIGIFFDIIGIASAAANETPFHAMGSERVKGAKQAILIVRNADRFSSFCNDVIGDITGIISGAGTAIVVMKLLLSTGFADNTIVYTFVSVTFAAIVSAITVGGKALGKSMAITYAEKFILFVGKVFYFLEHRLGIRIFNGKKKKSDNGKRGNKRAV